MEITVYRAQIKHIERTMANFTDDNLVRLLNTVGNWRKESNLHQDYDIFIHDHNNNEIYAARF